MATKPWHQQPTEPGASHARFLLYRNLGPCRSLRKAYCLYLQRFDGYRGGTKGLHLPHSWKAESKKFQWIDRAAAWDVNCMQIQGARVAALHASTVRRLAERCERLAKTIRPGHEDYADFITGVRTVGQFLSPELIRGVQERYRPADRTPVATSPDVE